MSKQISKDNREYWQNKLSNKFREKKQTIESLHQIEINEQSQKNYPIFKKRLGIEKDVLAYIKVEKDFNDYSKNYEKRLEEKRENVRKFFSKIRDKLKSWAETRDAFNDVNIPSYDHDRSFYRLSESLEHYLRDTCKKETKQAFYKSKKGQEIQKLDELEEKVKQRTNKLMLQTQRYKEVSVAAKAANKA